MQPVFSSQASFRIHPVLYFQNPSDLEILKANVQNWLRVSTVTIERFCKAPLGPHCFQFPRNLNRKLRSYQRISRFQQAIISSPGVHVNAWSVGFCLEKRWEHRKYHHSYAGHPESLWRNAELPSRKNLRRMYSPNKRSKPHHRAAKVQSNPASIGAFQISRHSCAPSNLSKVAFISCTVHHLYRLCYPDVEKN